MYQIEKLLLHHLENKIPGIPVTQYDGPEYKIRNTLISIIRLQSTTILFK